MYTRQRLVNNQLTQANWLNTQLENIEKKPDDFKSIDSFTVSNESRSFTAAFKAAAKEQSNSLLTPTPEESAQRTESSTSATKGNDDAAVDVVRTYKVDQTSLDKFLL